MLFETYKTSVRQAVETWLLTECDGEQMSDEWLEKVAKYLYANEYPDPEHTASSEEQTWILLYDFLRSTDTMA
jgi:hypothetical protein